MPFRLVTPLSAGYRFRYQSSSCPSSALPVLLPLNAGYRFDTQEREMPFRLVTPLSAGYRFDTQQNLIDSLSHLQMEAEHYRDDHQANRRAEEETALVH